MNSVSILVVNAGSSSLKFSLFHLTESDSLSLVLHGEISGIGSQPRLRVSDAGGAVLERLDYNREEAAGVKDAIALAGGWLRDHFRKEPLLAVGHRVVHGGDRYSQPVRIDRTVLAALERLVPLAPLHQPHNLAAIHAIGDTQPNVAQVACFDTAFHRSHPILADLYAIPWKDYAAGVRHYGFHGLSYEYIAATLPQVAPDIAKGRVIVAHLGSGASLCAMREGRSVDSTMGFSPLDGLPMGTRPGALDSGVLLHLLRRDGLSADALEDLLYHQSGLLGISGISNDMRLLLESNEPRARLAVDFFVHQVIKQIGALAAVLGGVEGLVFTAGIGEHSAEIRARIMEGCAWLGVRPDPEANRRGEPRISAPGSKVSVWVIPTDEELMIARHTRAVVMGGQGDIS